MKIRTGFVSNSSSSSFVISKKHLSKSDIFSIKNHMQMAQNMKLPLDISDFNAWTITETSLEIRGSTIMDNFDMGYFLVECLSIDPENIDWS